MAGVLHVSVIKKKLMKIHDWGLGGEGGYGVAFQSVKLGRFMVLGVRLKLKGRGLRVLNVSLRVSKFGFKVHPPPWSPWLPYPPPSYPPPPL